MKWLKHTNQLINLAHVYSVEVSGKTIELRGKRIDTILFNSEEAAEAYFEHVAAILEAEE